MPITVYHTCGHCSKVDKVSYGGGKLKGHISLNPNKPCPKCQKKATKKRKSKR